MADLLVSDWTEEFDALTESEIHTYAAEQEHNHEVMLALYIVFDEPQFYKNDQLLERICRQLFAFYRSGEIQLRKFVMQYVPSLIYLHLSSPKMYPAVETLIVSLYNLEVIDSAGQPCVKSFRVPSLAQSSIFHDSSNLEQSFVAESSLRRWEECNTKLVCWGPLPQVEALNAQNRQRICTALVFLYNQQIAAVHTQGVEHGLRTVSKLVSQGFQPSGARTSTDSDSLVSTLSTLPRIIMSSTLLLELLHVVYHALERNASGAAQTLHDVIFRANYDTCTDVLLMAHAVSNLLHRSPAAYMPRASNKSNISKSMITNASFRTKKLPDDIPILDQEEGAAQAQQVGPGGDASLDSIVEEGGVNGPDQDKTRRSRSGSSALKHLPKLPGLGKKPKLKSSPTPPRHSLEDAAIVATSTAGATVNTGAVGNNSNVGSSNNSLASSIAASNQSVVVEQVSLVASSSSNGSIQQQDQQQANVIHISTV